MIEGLTPSVPRVNYESMQAHIGKKVCLVGRIEQVIGNKVLVKTADGAEVTIVPPNFTPDNSRGYDTLHVEVFGQVMDPRTIQEDSHVNIQDGFSFEMYGELLKLSNGKFKHLF